MIQTACPSDSEIRDYLMGRLSDTDGELLGRHLEQCDGCRAIADRMENSGDSLLRSLRISGIDDAPLEHSRHVSAQGRSPSGVYSRLYQIAGDRDVSRFTESEPENDAKTLPDTSRLPTDVYHYRLEEMLGRGGMGVVYRSWHPQLHRPVAVKLLSVVRAADNQCIARFRREMRAAGGLDHPGIVRALDAGVWQGTNYLVMEFVDGIDLSRLIRLCGPLGESDAAGIVVQLSEAIEAAHRCGVIHRDIKPSNIMLTRDGHVKVLDFGLARLEPGPSSMVSGEATSTGRLLGTLDYLSPQQARGEPEIDHRADVYAIGATLFKLLTGQPPHGDSRQCSVLEHLQRLSSGTPNKVQEFRQDLSVEMCDLLDSVLNSDSQKRPPSAAAIAEMLRPAADTARLVELATQAITSRDEYSESVALSSDSAQLPHAPRRPVPFSEPQEPATHWLRWMVGISVLLIGLIGGYAGTTLWLSHGEALLKIESEIDDITLQLVKDGTVAEKIEIHTGEQSSSIRAGKYEIKIAGASDHIQLDTDSMTLMRGDQRVVRVTKQKRAPAVANGSPTGAEAAPPVLDGTIQDEPISRGKTYSQWANLIAREKDQALLVDAIDSLMKLTGRENATETSGVLLDLLGRQKRDGQPMTDVFLTLHYTANRRVQERSPGFSQRELWNGVLQAPSRSLVTVCDRIHDALSTVLRQMDDEAFETLFAEATPVGQRGILYSTSQSGDHSRTIGLCKRMRQLDQPDASCAFANYLLIKQYDLVPDEIIRQCLTSKRFLVSATATHWLDLTSAMPFPKEQGFAAGWQCGASDEDDSFQPHSLSEIMTRMVEGKVISDVEREFLVAVTEGLAIAWGAQDVKECGFGGDAIAGLLGAFEVMDPQQKEMLVGLLQDGLRHRLELRKQLNETSVPVAKAKLRISSIAKSLSFLTGQMPELLSEFRPPEDAAIHRVLGSLPEELDRSGRKDDETLIQAWTDSHPLVVGEWLVNHQSRVYLVDENQLHWVMLRLATKEKKIDQDLVSDTLAGLIGRLNWSEKVPPYRNTMQEIARTHRDPVIASAALVQAMKLGMQPSEVEELAVKIWDKEIDRHKPTNFDSGDIVVDSYVAVHTLQCLSALGNLSDEVAARIGQIVKQSLSSKPVQWFSINIYRHALRLHLRYVEDPDANRYLVSKTLQVFSERYRRFPGSLSSYVGSGDRDVVWSDLFIGVPSGIVQSMLELIVTRPFPVENVDLMRLPNVLSELRDRASSAKEKAIMWQSKYASQIQLLKGAVAAIEEQNSIQIRPQQNGTSSGVEPPANARLGKNGQPGSEATKDAWWASIQLQGDEKELDYARRIIERFDVNGDKSLSPSEWKKMQMNPAPVDTDKDGRITLEEYARWLLSKRIRAQVEKENEAEK